MSRLICIFQDKACEDVDETLEGSSSEYETDEEWEVERKKQAAIMEKDKVLISQLLWNR